MFGNFELPGDPYLAPGCTDEDIDRYYADDDDDAPETHCICGEPRPCPHVDDCDCDDCNDWFIGTCSKCGQYVYESDAAAGNAVEVTGRDTGHEGLFDHAVCPGAAE